MAMQWIHYLRSILEKNYGYYATGSDCEAVVYGIDMKSRADRIVTSGRARRIYRKAGWIV